jgi:Trk K+ transport system NAD-binding subunit
MAIRHVDVWQALYLAALTTIGGAEPDLRLTTSEKVLQILLTVMSIALVPAATAAVVEAVVSARLALFNGGPAASVRDHIIVAGLGDVGTRVLAALDDAGEAVVGIDVDPNARGVAVARQRHVPVVIGDAKLEATLRAAEAPSAHGLVALAANDVSNLEAALIARKLGELQHIVLRIFDAEFAERIQRAFGFAVTRSVSSLAGPSFAAAMLGREVIGTIAVHRRVLLVAEIAVGPGSALEGASIAQLLRDGETQVLAIRTGRGHQVLWSPPAGRKLSRTDQFIAITTRAGLGSLLARATIEPGATPGRIPVIDLIPPELSAE